MLDIGEDKDQEAHDHSKMRDRLKQNRVSEVGPKLVVKILGPAGVELFIGSKVQCMLCFEICTPEGRGEKRE